MSERRAALLGILQKIAADGSIDVENESPEPVKKAPAETPTETKSEKDLSTEETGKKDQTKFITDEIEKMLCQQIGNELFAYYEYTAGAAWFRSQGLDGFSSFAEKQAAGELCHKQKILDFLIELGCTPDLPSIGGVSARFSSVESALQGILKREKDVTKNWRIIAKKAMEDADAGTLDLAQWFVREQMEEEDIIKTLLSRLKAAGTGAGLLVLDHTLAG